MIPILLQISGFLSYKDPVKIDFTSFDLACIAGQNGAGKSSILDAITWALFGRARKHDESMINLQSELAEVRFVFSYEGDTYRVTRVNPRGKTKKVEFHVQQEAPNDLVPLWVPLSERTLRATDAKIEETLRLDYETFTNAAFFLQGEADQFAQQSPSDRKRILTQILGLGMWESYRKRAYQRRMSVEEEMTLLKGRLSEVFKELREEEERKNQLKALEKKLESATTARQTGEENLDKIRAVEALFQERRKQIESLTHQIENNERTRKQLEEGLAAREKEKGKFTQILAKEDEIKAAHATWKKAQQELEALSAVAEKFREQEKQRQPPLTQIASERARLQQELASLRNRREKLQEAFAEVPALEERLSQLETLIAEAKNALAQRGRKRTELEQARQKLTEIRAENPRLKTEMQELKARIDKLEVTEGATCPLCGQELPSEDLDALINHLNKEGTEMGNRYRANKTLLAEADELVKGLHLEIMKLSAAEDTLREKTREKDKLSGQLERVKARKKEWDEEYAQRLHKITKALNEKTFAAQARVKLTKIDAELKTIGYDAAKHDQLRETIREEVSIQDKVQSLEKAKAALKPLEREIEALKKRLTEKRQELKKKKKEKERISETLAQDEAEALNIVQAQRELLSLKEEENILQRKVGAARQKVAILAQQKERRQALEREREALAKQTIKLKTLERAFGKNGVPALLIEQALPQIEARANQILERLSNGTMAIRFLSQREYKNKKHDGLIETLAIQIRDQAGVRDYEMYSGGEAFRINFAIRLALSHVLAQRAGARLQTLVIDEGFGSQDAVGRQRLLEAINLIRGDFKKILVITHIDELKDAFSTQLYVEKTSHGSQVRLVG